MSSLLAIVFGSALQVASAQASSQQSLAQQVHELTEAMTRTQAQLEQSQLALEDMRRQLAALELRITQGESGMATTPNANPNPVPAALSESVPGPENQATADIRELQQVEASEIATQAKTKVESDSKYPVRITGELLFTGFANTSAVDMASTPTVALPGTGSTGATIRQTILGFDADGPHLFGAASYADLRVDFDGMPGTATQTNAYSGFYNSTGALMRLRTAHAGLHWESTDAFFSLDRPILSPDAPTSLIAVAEPALAWSGNLWTWNPQVGASTRIGNGAGAIQFETSLVDVGDAPLTSPANTSATPPSSAESSRWPGVEARVAWLGAGREDQTNHLGFGGYFAPHRSGLGPNFDSWASTADARFSLPAHLQVTGAGYRGAALGGLGGGGYKDFAYYMDPSSGENYVHALDDAGGWAQLKEKFSERLEANADLGMDNVFAGELHRFATTEASRYQNLARNRTLSGNLIYSPSAYLLFSVEYRRLASFPVLATPAHTNIIGLGAGYRF